jgi:hypothetical protein
MSPILFIKSNLPPRFSFVSSVVQVGRLTPIQNKLAGPRKNANEPATVLFHLVPVETAERTFARPQSI